MALTAITREVSPSMEACELTHFERQPIDIELAHVQHAAYCDCLRDLGILVVSLSPEPDFPDAVFVEDPAIVVDEIAVMTRPGAASRRGESESLARELQKHRPLRWMTEPALLDGGDVLRAGRTLFVGQSGRTEAAGIRQLATAVAPFGYHVKPVAVSGCLHLKSGASYLDDNVVLVHRPWVDAGAFVGMRVLDAPPGEEWGANVLQIGNTSLVAAGFPGTAELIAGLGRELRVVDNSELRKAEGALTCCSLIFNGWQA